MSDVFSYTAYGLNIRTHMPLPELTPRESAEADITVSLGKVDYVPAGAPMTEAWGYYSPAPAEAYMFWQEAGWFSVRGGQEIVVDPRPEVDERLLRLFVLSPVLAVALRQRGRLLLHASVVSVAGEAVAFLGSSGWGKSTMAAVLHTRGHTLITDDVAVLQVDEGRPLVFPGFPQLKLWPEAAVSLGYDPESLPRWNPHFEKRARRALRGFAAAPVPLKRMYVLADGDASEIEPLPPREALIELIRHTYGSDYGMQTLMEVGSASHFLQCTNVVNSVTISRLRRRRSLAELGDVARLVEEDLTRSTGHWVDGADRSS